MRFNLQRTSPRSQNDTEEYLQKNHAGSHMHRRKQNTNSLFTLVAPHQRPFRGHTRCSLLLRFLQPEWLSCGSCRSLSLFCTSTATAFSRSRAAETEVETSLFGCAVWEGQHVRREEGLGFSFCSKCRAQETTAHVSLKPSGRKHAQTLCQSS